MSRQRENSTHDHKLAWPRPFAGLRGVKVADLPRAIPAGITLAAMIIPLNIGFIQVAGLPATAGLYAGIIPLVLFAIFTSSRELVSSPDAPIAALLAATLAGFTAVDDPLRLQYALAIALLSGLIIYRFGAPLYFANASLFEEEVEKLVTQATTPVKWLVLDMQAIVDIDTSGAVVLRQILSRLTDGGVTVALSRAHPQLLGLLKRYDLLESIGDEHVYPTNRHAIAAYRQAHEQPEPESKPNTSYNEGEHP